MSPASPILKCDGCGHTRHYLGSSYPLLENLLDARGFGWQINLKRNTAYCLACRREKEEGGSKCLKKT